MTDEATPGPTLETLPDVELPDQDGRLRRLSDLAGGDPLVLQTYRGWFCPKERAYFRTTMLALQEIADVSYVRIVSLSVEPTAVQAAFRAGLEARWTFLSDADRTVQQQLGLREYTDTVHDPYLPAVFVVGPDLRVHKRYNGYWYVGRPSLAEIWADLREVTRALRPDWEAPGG